MWYFCNLGLSKRPDDWWSHLTNTLTSTLTKNEILWYWPWSVWTVWFLQSFIERLGLESTGGQQWQCVYIWRFMAVSCNIRLDVLIRLWGFNNNENVLWESLLFFAMCRKGWLKPFIRWNRGTNSDHVLQIWYISTTTKNTFYWISWAQASQQQWQCVFSNVASPLSIAWVIVVFHVLVVY